MDQQELEFNPFKLRELMYQNGDTQEILGNYLGISRVALNNKLTGKIKFSIKEMFLICQRYKVGINIFFNIDCANKLSN